MKVIPLLPEITELNLYRSSFRDVGCHDLFNNRKGLKNLKVLQVEFCGIGDIGASLISTLPDLEILSFGGNKISEIGLRHLSALPNLTYLDMSKFLFDTAMNEVSNKGAKIISKMSKLSSLLLGMFKFRTQITTKSVIKDWIVSVD